MEKINKYDPSLSMRVTYSQCNTCKNKECYWSGNEIIKLYSCINRKD